MRRHERGFTLIELIISMAVFVFALALISTLFINQLGLFKQQSKMVETKIEGAIGLEIMRVDIEQAGLGLSWQGLVAYTESAANPFSLNDAPTGVPKPIVSYNNVTTYSGSNSVFNGSDYLVIRSVSVARNDASQKWTTLKTGDVKKSWDVTSENLLDTDRVIVISPGATGGLRNLVVSGGNFYTTYKATSGFAPTDSLDTYLIYGINSLPASGPLNTPVRPFNRADYMITRVGSDGSTNIAPQRCAPNTGVLVKAVMKHDTLGTFYPYLPLLDCVADMQVVYGLDSDGDGVLDNDYLDDPKSKLVSAEDVRNLVKQVRVYILAHEGQRDARYAYPSETVSLGGDVGAGITFNLKTKIGNPEYKYYRWKVYTIVVQPTNLL